MICEDRALRGVNLGGWLVLEKWMTPSLFDGTDALDEYTFMQTPGAGRRLKRHRKTFITEKDFRWIATHGLNAVRIPVGYWLLDGDGPYEAGLDHLDWAMEMADRYDLRVLLDMHGAPGSQNGNDHSGHVGKAAWYRSRTDRDKTIEALMRLAERYRAVPALWGIELLNEPKVNPLTYLTLRAYYRDAYRALRDILYIGSAVVFSDAFVPCLFSGALKEIPGYPTVMDVHWYQFGRTDLESYFTRLGRRPDYIARLQRKQPVIIGEWSGMLSHETLAGLSADEKGSLEKRHIELQLDAYESAAGWFYWTYKTEEAGIWNFRSLVERGMFPVI